MMHNTPTALKDDDARREAINLHDQSILVEAGAGSGKTAIMAGRIAVMLAQGVHPGSIAAVTFTELAASELLLRVREFVDDLSKGEIPDELRVALPDGLSQEQRDNLVDANRIIDEITCSTIHGFCQHLIRPYPAEADIDPSAAVMDRDQADLTFFEVVDDWLRERLSGDQDGILIEMVLHDDRKTLELIQTIAENLRHYRPGHHPRPRTLSSPLAAPLDDHLTEFRKAAESFATFTREAKLEETKATEYAQQFIRIANRLADNINTGISVGLVQLLASHPLPVVYTQKGTPRTYKRKEAWVTAAKQAGLSGAHGEQLNTEAKNQYTACCKAWDSLLPVAAGHILTALTEEAHEILRRYQEHKRDRALIDFDDLIFAACDLLRKHEHEDVRRALGERFKHVLVDEFQDTSPLQTEIFWRLCGDPVDDDDDWTRFRIRPGALFLVGDPKQAIYRFRGADVGAYTKARDAFRRQESNKSLSISTNFRSCNSILTFVNKHFKAALSANDQPGFTALDSFHGDPDEEPCVAALDVVLDAAEADKNGRFSIEKQRDAEAEAVAGLCKRLIGDWPVNRHTGTEYLCKPGDIALLAPTGTDLWRYEEALERRGIPVATQAGKGLFRRQEIQDLIALTRVLADRRDTLALGALLRGPLVGLTEEELLDIVGALPRSREEPDRIPRLNLNVNPADVSHALARGIIEKLQALYRRGNSTTPHELLSQAVDIMQVRSILVSRHKGQAGRAIANVDLYLSLSTGYAVRGLRAFAKAMTAAWTEGTRTVEGRPDAQEEAVALFSIHAAKGLEWPIVIPVNTMTWVKSPDKKIIDRETNTFYCPILGVEPKGHKDAFEMEKSELVRERIRLWYVAITRARELLVLPRINAPSSGNPWISLVDLSLDTLPSFDASGLSPDIPNPGVRVENVQTHEDFVAETEAIAGRQKRLTWRAPSRIENGDNTVLQEEETFIWVNSDDDQPRQMEAEVAIQGGLGRGLILHKLMEEVLTGETDATVEYLVKRADFLIRARGFTPVADPATGLSAEEMANCVVQTLAIPEIANLRPRLLAEFPVYAIRTADSEEVAMTGFVDALTLTDEGHPAIIIDWKTDINPDPQTIDHYQTQVRDYLDMTGAERGMIVLMTTGTVIAVPSSNPPAAT